MTNISPERGVRKWGFGLTGHRAFSRTPDERAGGCGAFPYIRIQGSPAFFSFRNPDTRPTRRQDLLLLRSSSDQDIRLCGGAGCLFLSFPHFSSTARGFFRPVSLRLHFLSNRCVLPILAGAFLFPQDSSHSEAVWYVGPKACMRRFRVVRISYGVVRQGGNLSHGAISDAQPGSNQTGSLSPSVS